MNNTIQYICESDDQQINQEELIIVTMTSWPKRLCRITQSIPTLINQTMVPNKIILNLAEDEFPNKEKDFSEEVRAFLNNNKIIEVHWVKHNTRVWKKLIPTMLRFPNSYIIGTDDDWYYPTDFVEKLVEQCKLNNCPISTNSYFDDGMQFHCGCGSITKYDFYKEGLNILTKDIFLAGSDDIYYTYAAKKNNVYYKRFRDFSKSYTAVTNEYSYSGDGQTGNVHMSVSSTLCKQAIKK